MDLRPVQHPLGHYRPRPGRRTPPRSPGVEAAVLVLVVLVLGGVLLVVAL
ncbi:hypothetical protein [Streptomyces sp. N50]|nr:hypothetical protein [Streptomyces sp. N50]WOX10251.1 hypothetical protein R2B38_15965 [Streptomyces sp. N50]